MASKPETTFIGSIHKMLPDIYHEKMYNPLRGGTPDVFYSGDVGDLWVEYKYLPKIPRTQHILPALTALQQRWLGNRFDEGRNVAVIVGTPVGAVLYREKSWLVPLSDLEFRARLLSRQDMAGWIFSEVGTASCELQTSSSACLKPSKQPMK